MVNIYQRYLLSALLLLINCSAFFKSLSSSLSKNIFNPLPAVKTVINVPEGVNKERIDTFLASQSPDLSRSAISLLCESGKVFVNEKAGV